MAASKQTEKDSSEAEDVSFVTIALIGEDLWGDMTWSTAFLSENAVFVIKYG